MVAPRSSASSPHTAESLLQRLDWHVLRKLDGRLQGDYRSSFLGDGLDVSDLRDYQPDDDVRRIDWNVTARMDSPFVRQYDEDRDLTAWFLIDRTASMTFGHGGRSKADVVAEVAVALARVLSNRGNRIGALLWNGGIERTLQPRTGRPQVLRLARHLLAEPVADATETSLQHMLETGASLARRRSMVFIVSDFVSEPGWDAAMRRLSARHDVAAIRVLDTQEVQLPNAGLVVVQDAETGEQITVDTANPRFRERFFAAAEAREQRLSDEATRAGVDLHTITTEDDVARALLQMVADRKGRARR